MELLIQTEVSLTNGTWPGRDAVLEEASQKYPPDQCPGHEGGENYNPLSKASSGQANHWL